MADPIQLNAQHMQTIQDEYAECAAALDDAITALATLEQIYTGEYDGHAKETAPDTAKKLRQHVELLQQCCAHLAAYVAYCSDTATTLDNTMAGALAGAPT